MATTFRTNATKQNELPANTPVTLEEVDTSAVNDFLDQEDFEEGDEQDERAGAAYPNFFWMNKRPDAETMEEIHSGWHCKTEIHLDFDAAMETVAANGLAERVKVLHTDDEGNDVVQEYWHLTKGARVFVLSRGIPPKWQMNKYPEKNVGICYGWPKSNKDKKSKSAVKFQAILLPLYKAGYEQPVTFGCKATETMNLLERLMAHQRVVDAANAYLKSRGKPQTIKYRHIALDLLQADKIDWRKSKENPADKKPAYAIVTNIPKPSEPLPEQFFLSRYCGKDVRMTIDLLLAEAEAWSKTTGLLWRDGSIEGEEGSVRKRESDEDFAPDVPDDFAEEQGGLATSDQRLTLKNFAEKYRKFGREQAHNELIALATNPDLTDSDADRAIKGASRVLFRLEQQQPAPVK